MRDTLFADSPYLCDFAGDTMTIAADSTRQNERAFSDFSRWVLRRWPRNSDFYGRSGRPRRRTVADR